VAGWGDRPFGLRQIALYNSDGTGKLLLPVAMMLHFTPKVRSATFEADGHMVGAASFLAGAEWELEAGGISLEALAKLTGMSEVPAGSAPNRTLTLSQDAGQQFPYVRLTGRAVSDTGDILCKLYRCKLTAIEGTFRQREFWVTYCQGVAVSNGTYVYEFVQEETVAAL